MHGKDSGGYAVFCYLYTPYSLTTSLPSSISILIAARNEENTIVDCLRAIAQLNGADSLVEVLIGNDGSTDETAQRIDAFSAENPVFRRIDITEPIDGLLGKANVLAQLARQAKGGLIFFTDADTEVPPDWLTEMSRQFTGNVGIVTGVTLPGRPEGRIPAGAVDSPDGPQLFQKLQTIDWLYNLTLTHLVSSFGVPVTAMGNNMAVSRAAYEAIGGYESLPFSVTEDYALFQAVVSKGYRFRNLLSQEVLARTMPVETLTQWLQQRKRWMRGAMQLPAGMVALLYANYLMLPLLLGLAWVSPVLAVALYLLRLLVQTTVLSFGLSRLRQTNLWPYALLFEPYQLLLGPLSVLYYWLSGQVEWKGRKYK